MLFLASTYPSLLLLVIFIRFYCSFCPQSRNISQDSKLSSHILSLLSLQQRTVPTSKHSRMSRHFRYSFSLGPKFNAPANNPTTCTLPQRVKPHQKIDYSEKEQRSESLPVETAEPQVGLTGKPLPPDSQQCVLHWWQRCLSSQGSLLAFKSPGSLRPGSFIPLKAFGVLSLRQSSISKRKVCFSTSLQIGKAALYLWDPSPNLPIQPAELRLSSIKSSGKVRPTTGLFLDSFHPSMPWHNLRPQSQLQVPHTPISTEQSYKIKCVFSPAVLVSISGISIPWTTGVQT